jgi:hypothetical protein
MKLLLTGLVLVSTMAANAKCENRHTGEELNDDATYNMKSYELTANYMKKKNDPRS